MQRFPLVAFLFFLLILPKLAMSQNPNLDECLVTRYDQDLANEVSPLGTLRRNLIDGYGHPDIPTCRQRILFQAIDRNYPNIVLSGPLYIEWTRRQPDVRVNGVDLEIRKKELIGSPLIIDARRVVVGIPGQEFLFFNAPNVKLKIMDFKIKVKQEQAQRVFLNLDAIVPLNAAERNRAVTLLIVDNNGNLICESDLRGVCPPSEPPPVPEPEPQPEPTPEPVDNPDDCFDANGSLRAQGSACMLGSGNNRIAGTCRVDGVCVLMRPEPPIIIQYPLCFVGSVCRAPGSGATGFYDQNCECQALQIPSFPCVENEACELEGGTSGFCQQGSCIPVVVTPPACQDGPCCVGGQFVAAGASCDDGDAATSNDRCSADHVCLGSLLSENPPPASPGSSGGCQLNSGTFHFGWLWLIWGQALGLIVCFRRTS